MATHECPNCGSILDLKEPICPYCGAPNPFYDGSTSSKKSSKPEPPAYRPTPVVEKTNYESGTKQPVSFSVALLIILFIFFWPAAIVYIIVKAIK